MSRAAILQSNYLPWKGYFDLIASVDVFVIYDSVQYTRRDWRNRNKIKTRDGLRWITVPVKVKGRYLQTIAETELAEDGWAAEHLAAVRHAYARAPFFNETMEWLQEQLSDLAGLTLSGLNRRLIESACRRLGITTEIRDSSEFTLSEDRNERLADVCRELGVDEYVSGPAAKAYLDESVFAARNLKVRWKSYEGYPPYEQVHPPFEHFVSIVDVFACAGPEAAHYIRSARLFEA